MMMILVGGLYATTVHRQRQQRLQELRAEHQQIQSELRRVKAIADDARPVVVLENGGTSVIVDVSDRRDRTNRQPIYY